MRAARLAKGWDLAMFYLSGSDVREGERNIREMNKFCVRETENIVRARAR